MLSLAAFVVILVSGVVLAWAGRLVAHLSVGHFVNSLHLWSVELFFFFMVIHLWGKFCMAAWRGRRALTWITGVVAFLASIATAFTGYLSQQNFDSQWIAAQAKDGFNAVGIGAWFNVARLRPDAAVARRPAAARGRRSSSCGTSLLVAATAWCRHSTGVAASPATASDVPPRTAAARRRTPPDPTGSGRRVATTWSRRS